MLTNSLMKLRIPALPGWLRPWTLVLTLTGLYCLVTLATHSWDPMSFVLVGKQFDPDHSQMKIGYDGQFAYQIALNPSGAAPHLDIPAYRYQRILYPLLARALAFGVPAVIPWTLILINVISLAMGTLATELLLVEHGHSRWYALAYGGFSGLLLSTRLDLTEPLAFALAQWGLLFFSQGKTWRCLPLFAMAALTRELTLFFSAACVVSIFLKDRRAGLLWGFTSLLPFGVWQLALRLWLGHWGIGSGGAMATPFEIIPFRSLWTAPVNNSRTFGFLLLFITLFALLPAMLSVIVALISIWKRRMGVGVWLLLFNALIFPFLPMSNILNIPGLLRITAGLVVAVIDYGALESSRRSLSYSQLWLILLVFGEGMMAVH